MEVGEADGPGVQPVQVRRLEDRVAVARQVAVALVIGQDKHFPRHMVTLEGRRRQFKRDQFFRFIVILSN